MSLPDLARAVADAKHIHAVCAARLDGLQHYITNVVRPE